MAIAKEHEIHQRRAGRNIGVGLVLLAFVAVVFGMTVAKIGGGASMQASDHVLRPELLPQEGGR
ncbi:MAG: hypothetical protein ACK5IB_07030 [Qingshengfaniella sp.]